MNSFAAETGQAPFLSCVPLNYWYPRTHTPTARTPEEGRGKWQPQPLPRQLYVNEDYLDCKKAKQNKKRSLELTNNKEKCCIVGPGEPDQAGEVRYRHWFFSGSFFMSFLLSSSRSAPHRGPCNHRPSSYSNMVATIVLDLTSSHTKEGLFYQLPHKSWGACIGSPACPLTRHDGRKIR